MFNSSINDVSASITRRGFETILVGSPFSFLEKMYLTTLFTECLLSEEYLSNCFQKSTDLTLLDVYELIALIDKVLDFIEAYEAVDDLEVTDPDDELDDNVDEEYDDIPPLSMLMYR